MALEAAHPLYPTREAGKLAGAVDLPPGSASRLVPGGGLARHELAGGHTIAKHVEKTDAELALRLVSSPNVQTASTFFDRAIAEAAVADEIAANKADIDKWLKGTAPKFRIDRAYPVPLGRSLTRGDGSAIDASGARVILKRDPSQPDGFFVLTAFPQPTP